MTFLILRDGLLWSASPVSCGSIRRAVFQILFWILATALLGFLMARFLLRTDIAPFDPPDRRWKVWGNIATNFFICVIAFGLTVWFVDLLVIAFAERHEL